MSGVLGIDLGTTNSCVSVFQHGHAVVIPNQEGSTTTPSMVAFAGAGTRLVGSVAKRQILTNPTQTLYSVKRLLGRKFESPEIQEVLPLLTYSVSPAENGDLNVTVEGRELSLPEVQAEILMAMKRIGETYLGEKAVEAVITVPAYFNDAQRQATKDAGQIAGLNVLRIINEPTAASLAYGLNRTDRRVVAIYDLGGGTFDISILELGDGVFQVRATSGDTYLGGDDFDRRVMQHLIDIFGGRSGEPLPSDPVVLQRLKEASEQAKQALSSEEETAIKLPFLTVGPAGPRHLEARLTRATLEELVQDLVERSLQPCRQALKDSGLSVDEIQEVVLVGGQTRMPLIRRVVSDFFGREPQTGLNPDEVVAMGAAIQGAILKGYYEDVVLLDVTPLSLGIETRGGVFTPFIQRNTTIPTRKSLVFTTTEDNQSSVTVHVLQGERPMAADNISLAKFDLMGIPPAPRGLPKIDVTFDIDANGILSVSARDVSTGATQAVRVTPASGLSEEDIRRIIQEADEHLQTDKVQKALAALKNEAEATIYSAENLLRNHAQEIPAEQQDHCRQLTQQLRGALSGDQKNAIDRIHRQLKLLVNHILTSLL